MPKLRSVTGKDLIKVALSLGWRHTRTVGDHKIFTKEKARRPLVIRDKKDLPVFEIENNIRSMGLTKKEFLRILEEL